MIYWGIIKPLDLDIVASLIKTERHCLRAEQLSWLTTQDRLERKYWMFTTLKKKKKKKLIYCWLGLQSSSISVQATHFIDTSGWEDKKLTHGHWSTGCNPELRRPRWWRECTRIAEIVLSKAKDERGFQWRMAGRVDGVTWMPTWLRGLWI